MIKRILDLADLKDSDVLAIYPYGSRVYRTESYQSDYDFIVVHNGDRANDSQQFDSRSKDLSIHTYHADSWQGHLDAHKIFAIECFSQSPDYASDSFLANPFKFTLDKPTLRKEISSKASNSWVKCKKKLTVETDEDAYYIGIKSLFHSFRIPMFGIQIAQHGRIVDFEVANDLWWDELEPIASSGYRTEWESLKEQYQARHNELMTEFRKYAEKA